MMPFMSQILSFINVGTTILHDAVCQPTEYAIFYFLLPNVKRLSIDTLVTMYVGNL